MLCLYGIWEIGLIIGLRCWNIHIHVVDGQGDMGTNEYSYFI